MCRAIVSGCVQQWSVRLHVYHCDDVSPFPSHPPFCIPYIFPSGELGRYRSTVGGSRALARERL
eukprot:6556021-Pyramimonas_sp.AAC.1